MLVAHLPWRAVVEAPDFGKAASLMHKPSSDLNGNREGLLG